MGMFYFNNLGLVTDDQGNQMLYIPWKHIHGLYQWMVKDCKDPTKYPGHKFDRDTAAHILIHYKDALNSSVLLSD